MENQKALSVDQLNNLKDVVRQRFDELYHRIGSNRQNLMNKVLFDHHKINKELAKETIDQDYEREILRKIREIERSADKQLPIVPKIVPTSPPSVATAPPPFKAAKLVSEPKPKEAKPKEAKPKESKPKEAKAKSKDSKAKSKDSKAKSSKSKPAKKK